MPIMNSYSLARARAIPGSARPFNARWIGAIRQLVLHACTFGDKTPEHADAVVVELENGPRRFPFTCTYCWSRNAQGA